MWRRPDPQHKVYRIALFPTAESKPALNPLRRFAHEATVSRDPWPSKKVLAYIEAKSGTEFDGALAHAFTEMMGQWEPRLTTLARDETPPAAVGFPASTDQNSGPPE